MSASFNQAEILSYLQSNYLTIEQLSHQANVSGLEIEAFITNACIPIYSHKITQQVIASSPIFGETTIGEQVIFYYHPSLVAWAQKAKAYANQMNLCQVAKKMKEDFIHELRQALIAIDIAPAAFPDCFNELGELSEEGIQRLIKREWTHIMNGTYGVCLKSITAESLVIKNSAVTILEKWLKLKEEKEREQELEVTLRATEAYDSVASEFGPHEKLKSSRERIWRKVKSSLLVG